MSLYALMPGPTATSTKMAATALAYAVKRESPHFPDPPRPHPTDPMIQLMIRIESGNMARSDSFSSVSTNGDFSLADDDDSSFLDDSTDGMETSIQVEEVNILSDFLVRKSSGRASAGKRSRDSRLIRRVLREETTTTTTSSLDDRQKSGIEFRLNVTFAGRNYSIARSLLQIAQLRQKLVLEQQWASDHTSDDDPNAGFYFHKDVPSLPRLPEPLQCYGDASDLKSQINLYRPPLEDWFGQILLHFRDSHTLAGFLWEPLEWPKACQLVARRSHGL